MWCLRYLTRITPKRKGSMWGDTKDSWCFFLSFWSQSPLSCPSTALSYCFQMGESERPRFGCKAIHLFWSMLIGLVFIIIITDKWQDLPVSIKVSLSMLSFSSPHIWWLASAYNLTKIPSKVFLLSGCRSNTLFGSFGFDINASHMSMHVITFSKCLK